MKRERIYTCLIGALLAFFISLSGVMCIVTGFQMDLRSAVRLGLILGIYCVLAALCMTRKRGKVWLAVAWLAALLILWRRGQLLPGVEAVLHRISLTYNEAYGIGYIQWSKTSPALVAPDVGLCLIALLVATVILWTVCCRKPAIFGVIVGFIPLIVCLVVTYTVPAELWLFLLLAGQLLLMLTSSVRRRSAQGGNRLVALLLVPSLLAVTLLFWAVPQDGYQLQSNRLEQLMQSWLEKLPFVSIGPDGTLHIGDAWEDGTTVDLTQIGPRAQRNIPVMEVYAEESGELYLRGRQWDSYTGTQWIITNIATGYEVGWPDSNMDSHGLVQIETKVPLSLIYFPYYASGGYWSTRFTNGALENPYQLQSYWFYRMTPFLYTESPKLTNKEKDHYLSLPEETLARAKKHLQGMFEAVPTDEGDWLPVMSEERWVGAIQDYVRNSASYSLGTARMPRDETDFALWFLEESETGYCTHFASAAVVLLRAAGIPARYVTGYVVDAKADQYVTVTAESAHAWVEYYSDGKGWQILEVTPGMEGGEDPTEPTGTTQPPVTTEPPVTTQPGGDPTEPTQPDSTKPSSGETRPSEAPNAPSTGGKQDLTVLWKSLGWLGTAAGICAAVWGQFALRRSRRRKKMKTGPNNTRALAMWRETLRFGKLLKQSPPEKLLELAEKAKFSQHTLTDGELAEFEAYLNDCREKVAEKPLLWRSAIRLIFAI